MVDYKYLGVILSTAGCVCQTLRCTTPRAPAAFHVNKPPCLPCCAAHQGDMDANAAMQPQLHRGAEVWRACGLPNELPPVGPRCQNVSSVALQKTGMLLPRKGKVNSLHEEVGWFGLEHDDAGDASDSQQTRATCGHDGAPAASAKSEQSGVLGRKDGCWFLKTYMRHTKRVSLALHTILRRGSRHFCAEHRWVCMSRSDCGY